MESSVRYFTSSYVLQGLNSAVGFTIRTSTIGDKRDGKLIGYDVNPDFTKYSKFIQTTGDF